MKTNLDDFNYSKHSFRETPFLKEKILLVVGISLLVIVLIFTN